VETKAEVVIHYLNRKTAEAQLTVPDWGDKVDFGTGLSYRPADYIAGGPVRQPNVIVGVI
jgi:hypothetical protein